MGWRVLGIDLGTTRSVMAIMEHGRPIILANAEGNHTTPSVVARTPDGRWLVGDPAVRQSINNPRNTIRSVKRFMGRRFDDPEVERDRRLVPYNVVRAPNGDAWIELQGEHYSPPQISAMILRKLKADAEAFLGDEITNAVVTVPAYFDHAQHRATFEAGRLADVQVLRILNEPTAAALAYGLDRRQYERIAVYDLGGGTFDVSILELGEGVFEVKATNGDAHLGGDDFDQRIVTWLTDEFKREHGIDLRGDTMAYQRLKEAAEKAKIELSSVSRTEINLPFISANATGPKHLQLTLTRQQFEDMVFDLLERSHQPVERALNDACIKSGDINVVALAGGMTRMPAVRTQVKHIFGKEPFGKLNQDEAVALGAAIQAGVLSGEIRDMLLLDATSHSLGIETLGGVMTRLIERNTSIPTQKSQVFSTTSDGQTAMDIHVIQGEREMARDNSSLALIHLDGIPAAPRGAPHIEVTFDIDANLVVNVTARDRGTGREERVTVTGIDRGIRRPHPDAMPGPTQYAVPAVPPPYRSGEGDRQQASAPAKASPSKQATESVPPSPSPSPRSASPAADTTSGTSTATAEFRVFISHSHTDDAYCREFVEELRMMGADVWYDEHNMSAGMLLEEIQTQLGARPIFLVILTPTALHHSPWVKQECTWAWGKAISEPARIILPVTAAPISNHDLDDTWMFIKTYRRIEAPNLQPYPPREAARRAFDALKTKYVL